jgi:hypothetical protein
MKKHYETHVEDTDKLISVAGPELDYKSWYEQYRKLMEEQAQRKYGLYTPTSEGDDDDFPSITGMIARYSALGLTNEQMTENPVWKDLTGNGHDLQMKNFAWGGMSGVGGYGDENYQTFYKFTLDDYVFIASPPGVEHMNFTFRVTGLQPGNKLTLAFFGTTNTVYGTWDKDGIYTVDADIVEAGKPTYFYNGYGATRGEFTIEILPLYPGALVFDGVDDYGTCDNFPILTKEKGYTVVALRQWITRGEIAQGLVSNVKNWLKDGAFLLEYRNIQADHLNKPISFGAIGSEMDLPHILTYQTSKSYNGVSITTGNFEGTDVPHVGKLAPTNVGTYINAAIWEIVILDHDATEEELTKIKDYFVKTYPWLFPDQAWTVTGKTNEDEDRATIANITSNGNDLVLSNFGFAEGSGYGLYKTPFELYPSVQHSSKYNLSFSKFALGDHNLIIAPKQNDLSYDIKVKVTGLKEGVKFKWGWIGTTGYIDITTDGIHMLNKPASQIRQLIVDFAEDFDPDHVVTIEQIPEYEGYLVTDGVDDKAVSKQFKFGENFTVILDFKFPVKKISYCGFDLSSKVRIQNLQGSGVYVVLKGNKTLIPSNVVRAVTSEGKVYDENWNEYNIVPGNISSNYTMVNLGFDGSNQFAESATKLAGIYSSTLSKDDCIKAYNYLQTLKAK